MPPHWFCCLSLAERGAIRVVSGELQATLYVGFPSVLYDAYWLPVVYSQIARREAFLSIYQLERREIVSTDGVEFEAIVPLSIPFWVGVAVWLLDPASLCDGGCSHPRYGLPE